jgi:enoyl-CoA hydratase
MTDEIRLDLHGAVGEIVLNRPAKHNAMTPHMFELLRDVCAEADRNDAIHALVLRGEGERAFSAGTDVNTLSSYDDFWAWRNRIDYVSQIRNLRKPVIAAVRGWALGGGLELAAACDIRVAARDAVFGAPEVRLGWIGAGGTSQILPRLVGTGQALRILLTGDRITAEEALRIGLIEELVEPGEEFVRARALAEQIATYSPIATQAVKAAVRASMRGGLDLGLQVENELMTLCFAAGNDRAGAEMFRLRRVTDAKN